MSQEVGQTELKAKTQQLLDGPLKHIRAAAIAAALSGKAGKGPIVAIVSGGNIDLHKFCELISKSDN
mgnify:CR=1 FL=1